MGYVILVTVVILASIFYMVYANKKISKSRVYFNNNNLNSKTQTSLKPKKPLVSKEDFINELNYRKSKMDERIPSNSILDEHYIKKIELVKKAFDEPNSKDKLIYHGGCLSCITPETKGIGNCKGCKYFIADWSLPDLSTNK